MISTNKPHQTDLRLLVCIRWERSRQGQKDLDRALHLATVTRRLCRLVRFAPYAVFEVRSGSLSQLLPSLVIS